MPTEHAGTNTTQDALGVPSQVTTKRFEGDVCYMNANHDWVHKAPCMYFYTTDENKTNTSNH